MSLAAFPALAADEIGNNWLSIIQAVEGYGVKQVGTFNVRQFRNKAAGIRWYSMEQAPPSILAGSRQSAVYFKREKKIYVDTRSFGTDARVSLPQLELHELLGATGYDDSSYQSSMALLEIAQASGAAEAKRLAQLYGSSIFNAGEIMARNAPEDVPSNFRSGSGTSIGGGGDLNTIHIKAQVLKLIKSRGGVSNEFLVAYPNIAFEPITTPGASQIAIEYKFDRQPRSKKGYRETFAIFVPVSRWAQGPAEQQQMLEEIAHKVTSIFPAYGRGQTVTITPSGCPASKSISFPYTNDPSVTAIQRSRAERISNCYGSEAYSGSTVSPALPEEQMPKKHGLFYFTCTFQHASIGGQPYVVNTTSILGRSESKSLGVGWNGAQYMSGVLNVDRLGNIDGIAIHYISGAGERHFDRPSRPQSATQAYTDMEVDGSTLRFSCQRDN